MDAHERNLKKLEELVKIVDEGLTKEDFVKSFEGVINFIKKIEAKNDVELQLLKETITKLGEKLESDASGGLERLKKEAQDTLSTQIARLNASYEAKMGLVDARVAELKDGESITGPAGKDGKDGSPDKPEEVRDKLEELKGDERLDASAVKNLPVTEKTQIGGLQIFGGGRSLTIRGLGVTIDKNARVINFAGSGLTSVTRSRDGVVTVTLTAGAGAGTPVLEEVPVNSGDDTNLTIAHTPLANTFRLFRGGSRQASIGTSPDYTLTGTALVLTVPLDSVNNEVIFAEYNY